MSSIRGLLAVLMSTAVCGQVQQSKLVDVSIDEPAGVARTAAMVRSGVPMPRGVLASGAAVGLYVGGVYQPSRCKPLAKWPDGSVRWLQVDVEVASIPSSGQVSAELWAIDAYPTETTTVTVTTSGTAVTVDTGSLVAEIPTTYGGILHRVTVGGTEVLSPPGSSPTTDRGPWVAVSGSDTYYGGLLTPSSNEPGGTMMKTYLDETSSSYNDYHAYNLQVKVEAQNSLVADVRVSGAHVLASGKSLGSFIVRLRFFRGSKTIQVGHTWVHAGDDSYSNLQSYGLKLPFSAAGATTLAEGSTLSGGTGELYHSAYDAFTVGGTSKTGQALGTISRSGATGSIAVVLRDMAEQFPKALVATAAGFEMQLYPESHADWNLKRYSYTISNGESGNGRNTGAQGIGKTDDMWLVFSDTAADATELDNLAKAVDMGQLLLMADPDYYSDSRVMGVGPFTFPATLAASECHYRIDRAMHVVQDFFRYNQRVKWGWFGIEDYGDIRGWFYGGMNKWTWRELGRYGWSGNSGEPSNQLWMQWMRKPSREGFLDAEALARHTLDMQTVHFGGTDSSSQTTWNGKNSLHSVGTLHRHGQQAWSGYANAMEYSHVAGVETYYYVTGDRRAREVLFEVGKSAMRFYDYDEEQSLTNGIDVMVRAAQIYFDEAIGATLSTYSDNAIDWMSTGSPNRMATRAESASGSLQAMFDILIRAPLGVQYYHEVTDPSSPQKQKAADVIFALGNKLVEKQGSSWDFSDAGDCGLFYQMGTIAYCSAIAADHSLDPAPFLDLNRMCLNHLTFKTATSDSAEVTLASLANIPTNYKQWQWTWDEPLSSSNPGILWIDRQYSFRNDAIQDYHHYRMFSHVAMAAAQSPVGELCPTVSPAPVVTAEPTAVPTTVPTAIPTSTPTAVPTVTPTATPTAVPTAAPATSAPTAVPTTVPTATPTAVPTAAPTTVAPTAVPTAAPTTSAPTAVPTTVPTATPTAVPTAAPTTVAPTAVPTAAPTTSAPTAVPTTVPTATPTAVPTAAPTTVAPTAVPTAAPTTSAPTAVPTTVPTATPTAVPTAAPTTIAPTAVPTVAPITIAPTAVPTAGPATSAPTAVPTTVPTATPTAAPTAAPTTIAPTAVPTVAPITIAPTAVPSAAPTTIAPTAVPTAGPATSAPTAVPTTVPTATPTAAPTAAPTTIAPTAVPTVAPITIAPTAVPSAAPTTIAPTAVPTAAPTTSPTALPTATPTAVPTAAPITIVPTAVPTAAPITIAPTSAPTAAPTAPPTGVPTTAPTAVPAVTPTTTPTAVPTAAPTTIAPTTAPTAAPTTIPTTPTGVPTTAPTTSAPTATAVPTVTPTTTPTAVPTAAPTTIAPTSVPTGAPTAVPTATPAIPTTAAPTALPTTSAPTAVPTVTPTAIPSASPITSTPTAVPTAVPTHPATATPTFVPTATPVTTTAPTLVPTNLPTATPTIAPTTSTPDTSPPVTGSPATPTVTPTSTTSPTMGPGTPPTTVPSSAPVTIAPTMGPGTPPTAIPTMPPGTPPTAGPTSAPGTIAPTMGPGTPPTAVPTKSPSTTAGPTPAPGTVAPTMPPGTPPTAGPTSAPRTIAPTMGPGTPPTAVPTMPTGTPPTAGPTSAPVTIAPTMGPGTPPTAVPTMPPGTPPTAGPTSAPGTIVPTMPPGTPPTAGPTSAPVTIAPTMGPGTPPTAVPTIPPGTPPTAGPTSAPGTTPVTAVPTRAPLPQGETHAPYPVDYNAGEPPVATPENDDDSGSLLLIILIVLGVLAVCGAMLAFFLIRRNNSGGEASLSEFMTMIDRAENEGLGIQAPEGHPHERVHI